MKPFKVPLKIYQGASFDKTVTWKAGALRTPVDLTGCTAKAQIRASLAATSPLLTLSTETGEIALGGAAGTVTISLTDQVTKSFVWTTGVYDLEITFPNGKKRRLMYGAVSVSPEVTRD